MTWELWTDGFILIGVSLGTCPYHWLGCEFDVGFTLLPLFFLLHSRSCLLLLCVFSAVQQLERSTHVWPLVYGDAVLFNMGEVRSIVLMPPLNVDHFCLLSATPALVITVEWQPSHTETVANQHPPIGKYQMCERVAGPVSACLEYFYNAHVRDCQHPFFRGERIQNRSMELGRKSSVRDCASGPGVPLYISQCSCWHNLNFTLMMVRAELPRFSWHGECLFMHDTSKHECSLSLMQFMQEEMVLLALCKLLQGCVTSFCPGYMLE